MNLIYVKELLIHALLVPFYFLTKNEVAEMPTDKLDTLLLFVGLIVIAPITSNFIYSYKNADDERAINWGHVTTFFSIMVIGMLFITLDVLLVRMVGNVLVFRIALLLFWVAVVTFDFADFENRTKKMKRKT